MSSLFVYYEEDFNEKLAEIEKRLKNIPLYTFDKRFHEVKLVEMDLKNADNDVSNI